MSFVVAWTVQSVVLGVTDSHIHLPLLWASWLQGTGVQPFHAFLLLFFFLFLFMDVVLTVVFLKTASALLVFLQFCNSFINDYILPVFWTCILLMTCLASDFFLSQTKLLVSLFHKKNFVTLAPPPPQPFFQFLWKQSRCVLWIWLKATTLKPFFEFKNKTK